MNRRWGRSLVHIFALSEMALILREYVVVCYLSFAEEQIVKALSYAAFLLNYSVLSSKYKGSIFGQLLWMDFFFFLSIKGRLNISSKLIWSLISYTCLWHSCWKLEERRRQGKDRISLLLAISRSRFYFPVPFFARSSCKERITL